MFTHGTLVPKSTPVAKDSHGWGNSHLDLQIQLQLGQISTAHKTNFHLEPMISNEQTAHRFSGSRGSSPTIPRQNTKKCIVM